MERRVGDTEMGRGESAMVGRERRRSTLTMTTVSPGECKHTACRGHLCLVSYVVNLLEFI